VSVRTGPEAPTVRYTCVSTPPLKMQRSSHQTPRAIYQIGVGGFIPREGVVV